MILCKAKGFRFETQANLDEKVFLHVGHASDIKPHVITGQLNILSQLSKYLENYKKIQNN